MCGVRETRLGSYDVTGVSILRQAKHTTASRIVWTESEEQYKSPGPCENERART